MTYRLCIVSCHNFHREVVAAVAAEGWDDVIVVDEFPSNCGHPPLSWEELRALIPQECEQVVVLGRACMSALADPPSRFSATRIVRVEQCFHLVAGQTLVNEAIASGAYLITPSWLADWRGQIQELGFSVDQANEFFIDFAKELVLLDSGIDPESKTRFSDLGEVIKLPMRRIPVGLDVTRLFLARLVLEWRQVMAQRNAIEAEQRHAGELSDRVAVMDMLTRLARTQNEEDAIAAIEELFQMLFAPANLYYLRVENNIPIPKGDIPAEMLAAMRALKSKYALTADEQGFLLRIEHDGNVSALIAVDQLAFPQYCERYLNMALAVIDVCGLTIENVRNRRKLIEAEKMASLGVLIAGVAHEINTPLGVGLTATTTLQQQGNLVAQHFNERSMTQSELENYFESTTSATGLIQKNLERIGLLVDAFRHVALDEVVGTEKKKFHIRLCVDEVVRSLGDRLNANDVSVNIHCESGLEIESFRDDWVSIFINLISNSLKHGFKEREHGFKEHDQNTIDVSIITDLKSMYVDYRDNGIGLAPEVLAWIFDPFFTTDLQQSTGLGMYLVYNLITHRMNGAIQCQSEPGKGVHFHIEVPL